MSKNKILPNHIRLMLADTAERMSAIDAHLRTELEADYVFEQATPIQNSFGESYVLVVTTYDPQAAKTHPAISKGRSTAKSTAAKSTAAKASGGSGSRSSTSAPAKNDVTAKS